MALRALRSESCRSCLPWSFCWVPCEWPCGSLVHSSYGSLKTPGLFILSVIPYGLETPKWRRPLYALQQCWKSRVMCSPRFWNDFQISTNYDVLWLCCNELRRGFCILVMVAQLFLIPEVPWPLRTWVNLKRLLPNGFRRRHSPMRWLYSDPVKRHVCQGAVGWLHSVPCWRMAFWGSVEE